MRNQVDRPGQQAAGNEDIFPGEFVFLVLIVEQGKAVVLNVRPGLRCLELFLAEPSVAIEIGAGEERIDPKAPIDLGAWTNGLFCGPG